MSRVDVQLSLMLGRPDTAPPVRPTYELVAIDGIRGQVWAIQVSGEPGERQITGVTLPLPEEFQRVALLPTFDYLPDGVPDMILAQNAGRLHQIEELEA